MNHDWLNFFDVILIGMWCFWGISMTFLNLFQRLVIGVSIVSVLIILFIPFLTSVLRESISALFKQFIFLCTGFIFCGWQKILASIEVSWSLNPGDGSQLTTNVGQFVKSKSRVAFLRVLNSTIWVNLAYSKTSRKSSFNLSGYWGTDSPHNSCVWHIVTIAVLWNWTLCCYEYKT